MAVQDLNIDPVSSGRPFEVEWILDGTRYWFEFFYNARAAFWTMHVNDAGKTRLISGVRCVVGLPLLRLCTNAQRPLGKLILIDTSGTDTDPGPNDLGERCRMTYIPVDDL